MDCLFCGVKMSGEGDCPRCGSRPGERDLACFFQRLDLGEGTKVLEIIPTRAQLAYFPKFIGRARYTAVGNVPPARPLGAPHRFLTMEPTRLTFSDQSFEAILCNNVLPYLRSDYQAMWQIHRCLKPEGFAVITSSVTLTKTRRAVEMAQEDPRVYTDEYLAAHGTEWLYGEDYFERLEAAGFFPHRLRVGEGSEAVFCFKFKDSKEKFLEAL